MDIQRLRSETPGCAERIHLNNAGAGLMPAPVIRVIREHLELESRIGGYEAVDERKPAVQASYAAVAELLGTRPDNIAFTENATASYIQALSSIPFAPDDVILTTRNDYVSNQLHFLSLHKRFGVRVVRTPDLAEGGVDVAAMAKLARRHRPKLVCATHVPTSSGLVQDVAGIGRLCREQELLYLVDACQSVGQIPLDVQALGCDFLSATARKFLRGPRGAGFLYVSDRALQAGLEPLFIDMQGADWIDEDRYRPAPGARRFENWEFAYALVLGTGEAARYAIALGVGAIQTRVRALADRLRCGLGAVDGVRLLDRGAELAGIVTAWVDGHDPDDLVAALRRRRINASSQVRGYAVLHYDDRGVSGSLRLSPHYYNTEAEIDEAVAVLGELLVRS